MKKLLLALLLLPISTVTLAQEGEMTVEEAESIVNSQPPTSIIDAGSYIVNRPGLGYGICFRTVEGIGACQFMTVIAEQFARFQQAEAFLQNKIAPGEISPDGSRRSAQNEYDTDTDG